MRWLAVVVIFLAARAAAAGPYCGNQVEASPASESTVPIGATIAVFQEDGYYQGLQQTWARAPRLRITLDGKPVAYSATDAKVIDGVVRYIKIKGRATGKLEISVPNSYARNEWNFVASYTVAKDVAVPERVTATVERGEDNRLGPYHYMGEQAVVRVDGPAIGFTLKWRATTTDRWVTHAMPVWIESWPKTGKRSEMRIGQTMCGSVERIPLAALKRGIEVQLTAKLVDGRTVPVEGLERVVLPPAPPRPAAK